MASSNTPNLECRMYEERFPEKETPVVICVTQLAEMGAYGTLPEYNNAEGMVLYSELSKRRIRSVTSLIKVGRQEIMTVIRVDKDKGYIDLSKRRVDHHDARACAARYNKSKLVHSIMRHVAETVLIDLEELYINVGWPLYRKYGHAYEAFKEIVLDADSVLDTLTREVTEDGPDGKKVTRVVPAVTREVKKALVQDIRRRMTPQPLKIRADIELKCFGFDGVLHIQEAMRTAEGAGNDVCPVKVKYIAAPLYVLATQTLDKNQGISVLKNAIEACKEEIERHNGKVVVKVAPRTVSEYEDQKLLADHMAKSGSNNEEIGDDDSEEGSDTGMGDGDFDDTNTSITA